MHFKSKIKLIFKKFGSSCLIIEFPNACVGVMTAHPPPNSYPDPFSCQEKGKMSGVVIPLYFQERGTEGVSYNR